MRFVFDLVSEFLYHRPMGLMNAVFPRFCIFIEFVFWMVVMTAYVMLAAPVVVPTYLYTVGRYHISEFNERAYHNLVLRPFMVAHRKMCESVGLNQR